MQILQLALILACLSMPDMAGGQEQAAGPKQMGRTGAAGTATKVSKAPKGKAATTAKKSLTGAAKAKSKDSGGKGPKHKTPKTLNDGATREGTAFSGGCVFSHIFEFLFQSSPSEAYPGRTTPGGVNIENGDRGARRATGTGEPPDRTPVKKKQPGIGGLNRYLNVIELSIAAVSDYDDKSAKRRT